MKYGHLYFVLNFRFRVFLGRHDKLSGGREYSVETAVLHPNREEHKMNNDLAILTLTSDIMFTRRIQPICLPVGRQRVSSRDTVGYLVFILNH